MSDKSVVSSKSILKLVLLIIGLILVTGGASFAVYNFTVTGSKNSINTTSIGIDFLESEDNVINIDNALPMTDTEGIDQEEEFTFAVKTKTTRETTINYTIYIEKLAPTTGYTLLNDSDIKVYLEDYDENTLVNPTLISNLNNYELYTSSHTHNTTNEEIKDMYRLRAWIDQSKSTEAQTWDMNTKKEYKFKLGVRMSDAPNN